jgi:hypothetical protein
MSNEYSFLPGTQRSARSGNNVKGGFGCALGVERPPAKPLTFWSGGYLCLSGKECKNNPTFRSSLNYYT